MAYYSSIPVNFDLNSVNYYKKLSTLEGSVGVSGTGLEGSAPAVSSTAAVDISLPQLYIGKMQYHRSTGTMPKST